MRTGELITLDALPLRIVALYEQETGRLFHVLEPTIRLFIEPLGDLIHFPISLQEFWRHIFILLWLHFGTIARETWIAGNLFTSVYYFSVGGVVALLASVGAGAIALSHPSADVWIISWFVAGILLYEIATYAYDGLMDWDGDGGGNYSDFGDWLYVIAGLRLFPGSLLILAAVFAKDIPLLSGSANPAVTIIMVAIILNALAGFVMALDLRGSHPSIAESDSLTYWEKVRLDSGTRYALDVFTTLGLAVFLIAVGELPL